METRGRMKTTLGESVVEDAARKLGIANAAFKASYPGNSGARQPVHVVYGGAHLFKATTAERLGTLARKSLADYAPDGAALAEALGLDLRAEPENSLVDEVYARILAKLSREAVEDFRVDFEDGYGNRSDAEEDGHAVSSALEVAKGMAAGSLPPFIGIRIKPLTEELQQRSLRTLDLFLTALLEQTGGRLPERFVVTLPKISMPSQPAALAEILSDSNGG